MSLKDFKYELKGFKRFQKISKDFKRFQKISKDFKSRFSLKIGKLWEFSMHREVREMQNAKSLGEMCKIVKGLIIGRLGVLCEILRLSEFSVKKDRKWRNFQQKRKMIRPQNC